MTGNHTPPNWIKAYDGGSEFWPPFWDQGVLRRILSSPEACSRLDTIFDKFGPDTGQDVLEACLSARGLWESAAKAPQSEQERVVKEIRGLTLRLVKAIHDNEEALRAYRPSPLSLPMLLPERVEFQCLSDDEAPSLQLDDVLNRFHESLRHKTVLENAFVLPAKPNHPNAFRTYVAQNMIRLLRKKTGHPMHNVVAELTNIVINKPHSLIDQTHVAKLDPGDEFL